MGMKRTAQQNRALHKGFELVAKALTDAGLDMRAVLKPEIDIPWTTVSVKEYLFRPIVRAMTSKLSTADLDKIGEIEAIWEVLMRHLMEKHHIEYIHFPSQELGYWDSAPMHSDLNTTSDTIDDGFGSVWYKTCPECGKDTIEVVRPGKVQCTNCE